MAKNKKKDPGQAAEQADAKEKKAKDEEPKHSFPREILEILMYGLALLVFFKTFSWQNFQIPTESMENNLLIGDHITSNNFVFKEAAPWEKALFPFRDIERGDVVVFKWPGDTRQDWIKRCIGLPGDRFHIEDDVVFINGERLEEAYPFFKTPDAGDDRDPENRYYPVGYREMKPGIDHADFRRHVTVDLPDLIRLTKRTLATSAADFRDRRREHYDAILDRLDSAQPGVIPNDFYLMMGDNRNRSHDSRGWGLVPRELIEGRAWFVWWSYGEDEGSHQLTGVDKVWSYLRVPITFWTRTRWSETFSLIK